MACRERLILKGMLLTYALLGGESILSSPALVSPAPRLPSSYYTQTRNTTSSQTRESSLFTNTQQQTLALRSPTPIFNASLLITLSVLAPAINLSSPALVFPVSRLPSSVYSFMSTSMQQGSLTLRSPTPISNSTLLMTSSIWSPGSMSTNTQQQTLALPSLTPISNSTLLMTSSISSPVLGPSINASIPALVSPVSRLPSSVYSSMSTNTQQQTSALRSPTPISNSTVLMTSSIWSPGRASSSSSPAVVPPGSRLPSSVHNSVSTRTQPHGYTRSVTSTYEVQMSSVSISTIVVTSSVSQAPTRMPINYPPKIIRSPVSQIKNETQDMSMNCTLEGKPRSDVQWLKDNKELAIDKRMALTNTNNTWSLTISNLRGEDGGLYACEATNKVGRVISRPGKLDVYYPPSVNKQLKNSSLPLGAELKLDCGAKGNPFPTITWTKDSSSKIPNARFSDRKRVLSVDSVRVDDIGVYQCAARNLLGFVRSNIASVDVETLLTIVNQGELFTATEGDRVKLRCVASSLVTPTVSWKRGSKTLESSEKDVSKDGKVVSGYLILKNVKTEDAGQYVCVARNGPKIKDGKIELTVNVNVEVEMDLKLEGKEFSKELKNSSSPEFKELASEFETELSVIYQNTTGFIRVEVLEFRNGSVEVRFRVILEIKVKKPEEAPAPDVKVKVTKVIVVKVTESKGKIGKLRIKPESIRPKVEPPAPQNLTTISVQRKEIQIKWSPPQFHEIYDVLQYIVEFKKFGKEWEEKKTKNDHMKTYRLTDLEADTKYLLRVSAVNKYGTSIPSSILAKKTSPVPEESNLEILLPVLAVVGVVFLLFVVYFCCRQRRIQNFYPDHVPEERKPIEMNLQQLNYACGDIEPELSGEEDLADRMLQAGAWREIPRDALTLGEELGSGMFGQVVKAWLQRESGESQVCAVKMLKASATELEYRDLANEVEIMSYVGEHPNLVNLIGVCSVKGPLYVVVEFAENGSLLEYLRQNRSNDSVCLSNIDKFIIAFGVAKGMNHLTSMKCIHRDLSARNVLLGKDMTPKVADFGLSRDVYERGCYEKTTGGKLPARWMAIEALERSVFTSEGDVWSFGVLLWEIETGGKLPYAGMEVKQLLKQLKSGYRLEKPTYCTDEIHDIMMWCWLGDPAKRPTFQDLCSALETLINGNQQKARPVNPAGK